MSSIENDVAAEYLPVVKGAAVSAVTKANVFQNKYKSLFFIMNYLFCTILYNKLNIFN
ncbi:hypothetical protein [Borrelia duttonii]|uniref:hypothetical protein n=1 Tax=Borrelia duttonii TaxID=40834 RepID=UPI00030E6BB0